MEWANWIAANTRPSPIIRRDGPRTTGEVARDVHEVSETECECESLARTE